MKTRNAKCGYVVAATPRTGSSLLCECLEATGIAGRPAEVFAPDFRQQWRNYLRVPPEANFEEYVRIARAHGTTPNGVYALKIQWMHVTTLANELRFVGRSEDVLETQFPCSAFVNVVRHDRRAQALSWYRACTTNEWWRFVGDLRIRKRPALNMKRVLEFEDEIERQQSSWERYFSERASRVLRIEYESLSADCRAETEKVLTFLGLEPSVAKTLPEPRLVRQSDDLAVRWRDAMELAILSAEER